MTMTMLQLLVILASCWIATALGSTESEWYYDEDYCNFTEAAAASRRFSYALLKMASNLLVSRRNMLITPLSVGMSLAMVTHGSSGVTRSQIISALEQRQSDDQPIDPECLLRAYYGDLYNYQFIIKEENASVFGNEQPALLRTGTRLFGERSYVFREEFVQSTGKFGAEMDVANFKTSPTIARKKINSWVSEQTDGSIPEIFREGSLSRSAALAATCALFFKGGWQIPFVNDTQDRFYHVSKRYRLVDYMTLHAPFRRTFSSRINSQLVEIPYASPDGSNVDARLILILPNKTSEIRSVESRLSDDDILPLLNTDPSSDLDLHIPKFTLSGYHKLKFFLKRMGVRAVFSWRNARLPGLTFEDPKQKRLFLSHIQHMNRFQINEYGTHVDSVMRPFNSNSDGDISNSPARRLSFNRPFLFLIYEAFSQNIIFMGRLSDPLRTVS